MTSTRLPAPTYLDHITRESRRFRDTLATVAPDTPIPSAPDWTAADLLSHLSDVQDFWTRVIESRPQEVDDIERDRPTTYAARLDLFDRTHAAFVSALGAADPDEPAWNWSGIEQTASFTYRRQAHEALIHRLDAELAAGAVTPLDPELALDGIDETLAIMYGGIPPWGSFDPLPQHIELRASDLDRSVWARLGLFSGTSPHGKTYEDELDLNVVDPPATPADVVVSATADDLDAWLWHRRGEDAVTVTGDGEIYRRLREILDRPID